METANDHPPLPGPGLGFEVVRLDRSSVSLNSSVTVHHIGIYRTLALAQAVALVDFRLKLDGYLHTGYHGRYHNQIDLEHRGLITAYQQQSVDGYTFDREIALTEFRIGTIAVWDNAWKAETRLLGEELSFGNPPIGSISNVQGTKKPMLIVRLPDKPDQHGEPVMSDPAARRGDPVVMHEPTPLSAQIPPPGPHYYQERQPDWSRTRTPLFDRRDDAPFRRPGDAPYAQVMTFSLPAPTLRAQSGNFGGAIGEARATV
jgi:hypothetical protein